MKHKTMQIVEFSNWMFPAIILSGWLSPLIFVINLIAEVLGLW